MDENERQNMHQFWETRGSHVHPSPYSATMFAEHDRYTQYIHIREMGYLRRCLSSLHRPTILDQGCGTGRLSLALADLAGQIVGQDFAASLVEHARRSAAESGYSHLRFEQKGAEESPNVNEVDVVLFSGVFPYLDDSRVLEALAVAKKTLKPGGILYMRNHCANIVRHCSKWDGINSTIYRTHQEYRIFLDQVAGFEVYDERYLFPPLCLPNLMYYHMIPKILRERWLIRKVLGLWFDWENATAEIRLKLFGGLYPTLLKVLRKPTSFHVLLARRV